MSSKDKGQNISNIDPQIAADALTMLSLDKVSEGPTKSVTLTGTRDLSLFVSPPEAEAELGPNGLRIAPQSLLRSSSKLQDNLSASAVIILVRFTRNSVANAQHGGMILNMLGSQSPNITLLAGRSHNLLRIGQMSVAIEAAEENEALCFALCSSGKVFVVHQGGFLEEFSAGNAIEKLTFRQVILGHRCPVTFHDLGFHLLQQATVESIRNHLSTLAEVFLGRRLKPARDNAPVLIHFGGQSLAVGPRMSPGMRTKLDAIERGNVLTIDGAEAGASQRKVLLRGPLSDRIIDHDRPISLAPARVETSFPPAVGMAQALAGESFDKAFARSPFIVFGAPVSGQKLELLDDPEYACRPNTQLMMRYVGEATERQFSSPEKAFYFWVQGEADKQLLLGEYERQLSKHWEWIKMEYAKYFPDLPPKMLIMQTGSNRHTHNPKEPWNVSTDQLDFVAKTPDAELIGPVYPFRLSDQIHPNLRGSRIMGELAAWAAIEITAGRPWSILKPSIHFHDDWIVLHFPLRSDEALFADPSSKYAGIGIDEFFGLEAVGGKITAVKLDGHKLHMQVEGPVTEIRYAMQQQDLRSFTEDHFAARRGLLRTTLTRPAVHMPGVLLYRWIPSFRNIL